MINNLTDQYISQSFQNLVQYSGSGELFDGIGNTITALEVTTSFAQTASYALNATEFPYTGSAEITGSLSLTGSLEQFGDFYFSPAENVSFESNATSSTAIIPGFTSHTGNHIKFSNINENRALTYGMLIGSASVSGNDFPVDIISTVFTSGSDATLYSLHGFIDATPLGGSQLLQLFNVLESTGSLGIIRLDNSLVKQSGNQGEYRISRNKDNEVIQISLVDTETALRIRNNYSDNSAELFKIIDNNQNEIFTVTNSSVEVTSSLNISGSVYITNVLDLSRSGSLLIPIERKPLTANTATGSIYVDVVANELFVFTGNGGIDGWVSASLH
jgi:hypothetical protein